MAKQIKVIKCPQCGSTNNTKLGTDRYKCNNCDAEYFLDNDDVNVNVNYSYNHRSPSVEDNSNSALIIKRVVISIVVFIIVAIIVNTCVSSLSKKSSSKEQSYGAYSSSSSSKDKMFNEKANESISKADLFVSKQQEPLLFVITNKNRQGLDAEYEAKFISLKDNKVLGTKKLDVKKLDRYDLRTFSDGNTYVLINKKYLYTLNFIDYTLENVTESLFNKQDKLSAGLASIEFVRDDWGDGFNVITNLSKEYYYYPIVNKLYTKDNFFDAVFGFNNLLPGAHDVTYYEFTSRSRDFEEEPIQLLQIVYKTNSGGPEEKETNPVWFKDYGGSGIFTDRSPYTKRLFNKQRNRIVSYKDITPGRNYFSAGVKYYDDKHVIISFKPTIAEDAPRILQCLSIPSYDVVWSYDLNTDGNKHDVDYIVKTKDGYVCQLNTTEYIFISNDGKLEKKVDL